jgi:hypothetical protein
LLTTNLNQAKKCPTQNVLSPATSQSHLGNLHQSSASTLLLTRTPTLFTLATKILESSLRSQLPNFHAQDDLSLNTVRTTGGLWNQCSRTFFVALSAIEPASAASARYSPRFLLHAPCTAFLPIRTTYNDASKPRGSVTNVDDQSRIGPSL